MTLCAVKCQLKWSVECSKRIASIGLAVFLSGGGNVGRNIRGFISKIPSKLGIHCVQQTCVSARRAERHQVRVPEGKGVLTWQEDSPVVKASGEPDGREV